MPTQTSRRRAARSVGDLLGGARLLVFDFDGTLVASNQIKFDAFEHCFRDYPRFRNEIMAYCLANHHTPRAEKFHHVYTRILGQPYSPEIEARLLEEFARQTTEQIIAAPEVAGAGDFLRVAARSRETAVLSSTPHDILVEILRAREWLAYFHVVRGAPVDKASWLRACREERGLSRTEAVFFGDTDEDAGAAREAGFAFVAVAMEPTPPGTQGALSDFAELAPATDPSAR